MIDITQLVGIGTINFAEPAMGNFLVVIINWLINLTSSIAVGVILFTLILKLITLPFDFFSRVSMRKNSIKMEEMREDLEKLQKQYANDKNLYQQKMMALYKKNGYSAFGSCLPSIITLVIFIFAIGAFTSYSHYQNVKYFYDMSVSYNNVIYYGIEHDEEYIKVENNKLAIDYEKLKDTSIEKPSNIKVDDILDGTNGKLYVTTANAYIVVCKNYNITTDGIEWGSESYFINKTKLTDGVKNEYNNYLKNSKGETFVLTAGTDALSVDKTEEGSGDEEGATPPADSALVFLQDVGSTMAAKTFREIPKSFLWVKNIWIRDGAKANPVENYEAFKANGVSGGCAGCSSCYGDNYKIPGEESYNILTKNLTEEKTAPNGYYILPILTAAITFLMQFIMTKSQKASMELQTVDGQGMQTQKMMMWMMPIMMAVFAFMYTAAFSVYIIVSSLISIGSTLLINLYTDKKYGKPKNNSEVIRGRVYNKEEDKKPVATKPAQKKADFINGSIITRKKGDKK
ncbi:MAG: YidC/Oxa1 family membrane protein insertase [Candidatus Borkfalkiaceae bacterium]|nr:YidC/Oxa1 family membrane protein insertase [Christensenellaceae bacterium]